MTNESISTKSLLRRVVSEEGDIAIIPDIAARRMLFSIFLINSFERSVIDLKAHDCVWGPIHISIGQEAIAATAMAGLRSDDMITGSHRAHHIALAKIMEHVLPDEWDPAKDTVPQAGEQAVYRTLAEIMGLADGYCGGRGGSMHLRNREAGLLGTNAIVAGGVPLSVGAALASRKRSRDDVVLAFMGDGAVNQGAFHEACNMANLWKLPIGFVVENNQYAVATSVHDATAASELTELAAAYEMDAFQVLGYDVPALYQVFRSTVDGLRTGGKPVLIEAKCYRHFHHGGDVRGSKYGYRTDDEEEEWLARDAYARYPELLTGAGIVDAKTVESIRAMADEAVAAAVARCTVDGDKPTVRPELWPAPETVREGVRSDGSELEHLRYADRGDFTGMKPMAYSDAIAAATGRWMETDESVVVIGEEVANFGGGAYGATKGLPTRFPDRIMNTPISEGGFCGVGLGAAMNGLRPVVEIMFPDFALVAGDQVFNQIGKARHMYGNTTDLPLVLRMRIGTGCGYGGQHSMDPVGLFALFPGWRIIAPSDSFEYIGLFNTAMHSLDPVAIFEHHSLYARKTDVPDDLDYCIPFGEARVVREGTDMTVAVYGSMVARVTAIAEALAAEAVSIEVIDLRTLDLASLDFAAIGRSLDKTGAFAIVEQAAGGQAIGRHVAAIVTERYFDMLDAPSGVITALDVPNPVSRALEDAAMVSDEEITTDLRMMARREWK